MSKRTTTLSLFPMTGGVNTSADPGLIAPGQLTIGDNLVNDYMTGKRRREGIDYNWDDGEGVDESPVVGGIDYWFGTSDNKAQFLITVLANGHVYRTSNGVRTLIADGGAAWSTPLTEANLEVFNNRVMIAVSGVNNRVKYWDGDPAEPLRDLPALLNLTSVSRASSGTTRTLVFSGPVNISNGEPIIIYGDNASYIGSYTLLSGSGTNTITYTAGTSLTQSTTADTTLSIGNLAPLALFLREHQGRLVANDKTRLDFFHYSEIGNHLVWGGVGTSGGFPIAEGDGDPNGITGFTPTFKGVLFIGKRTKLYRLDLQGGDFDLASVTKVSNGIGFISHQAIAAIDQDDVFFCSDRGFHSLAATNAYGDFTASYISRDIQRSFVENWETSRRRYIKAAYLAEINSAVFSVTERGSQTNNALWLFDIERKEWLRWPDVEAGALISAQDTDRRRVYLGLLSGRLAQTLTGRNIDIMEDGTEMTIFSVQQLGLLFPDQRPDTIKGFKKVGLVYRSVGGYSVTVKAKIDNFSEQAIAFSSSAYGAPLGAFTLGVDVLGASSVIAPYSLPIDGFGRGIRIRIEQNDLNTALSVQGLTIEYEVAGDSQETRDGDDK